jgi:hypothetical protein
MPSEKRRRSSGLYWAIGVVVLAPVLYVLSFGPVAASCIKAGVIPEALDEHRVEADPPRPLRRAQVEAGRPGQPAATEHPQHPALDLDGDARPLQCEQAADASPLDPGLVAGRLPPPLHPFQVGSRERQRADGSVPVSRRRAARAISRECIGRASEIGVPDIIPQGDRDKELPALRQSRPLQGTSRQRHFQRARRPAEARGAEATRGPSEGFAGQGGPSSFKENNRLLGGESGGAGGERDQGRLDRPQAVRIVNQGVVRCVIMGREACPEGVQR